jgi:hypothetical protein
VNGPRCGVSCEPSPLPFRRPRCWRHGKLCIIELGATGLRAVANTMPLWKGHERGTRYPATHDTCGMAKTEGIPIVEPDGDQPQALEAKPGAKPNAKGALKSLLLPEICHWKWANIGKPA